VQRHAASSLRYYRSAIAGRGNGRIMQMTRRRTMIGARCRKSQPGQALVETGLAITLFIVVVLGMIEFGYAFMALNVITQAATAGARVAGALQVGNRGPCGRITDTSSVDGNPNGLVRQQIGGTAAVTFVGVTQNPDPNAVCTPPASTIPTVTVTVTANLPHLFGLLGSGSFSFTRAVTFRDEGR
jgi:Flp pilus assembly protein TadG